MILTINPLWAYKLAELLSRDKQKLSKLGKQRDGGSKKRTIHPSRKRVNSSSSNMRRKMSGRVMTQGGSGILSSFSGSSNPKLSMKSRQELPSLNRVHYWRGLNNSSRQRKSLLRISHMARGVDLLHRGIYTRLKRVPLKRIAMF